MTPFSMAVFVGASIYICTCMNRIASALEKMSEDAEDESEATHDQ